MVQIKKSIQDGSLNQCQQYCKIQINQNQNQIYLYISLSLSVYIIFFTCLTDVLQLYLCVYISLISAHMFAHPIRYLYIFKYLEKEKVKIIYHGTTFFIWIKVRLNYSQIYFRMFWNMYLIKEYGKQLIMDKSIFGRY